MKKFLINKYLMKINKKILYNLIKLMKKLNNQVKLAIKVKIKN